MVALEAVRCPPLLAVRPRDGLPRDSFLRLLLERRYRRLKERCVLRHLTLEVTSRCNLRCRHCYASATETSGRELSFIELCALGLEIRLDFGTRVRIAVTGGEPFLRPDLVPLLRLYRVLGLPVTLATNGTLLTRETARAVAAFVDGFSVSLDGLEAGHDSLRGAGSFRLALRGLVRARAAGIPGLSVKTAVFRENLRELPGLHRLLRELDVPAWHLFPVEPMGRGRTMRQSLLSPREHAALCAFFDALKRDEATRVWFGEQSVLERRRPAREGGRFSFCSAGISTLSVLPDGDVVACAQSRDARRRPEGNVRCERLLAIWRRGFHRYREAGYRSCGDHRFAGR